jgi:uncharacterized repeat protein (TIGR01451 family)
MTPNRRTLHIPRILVAAASIASLAMVFMIAVAPAFAFVGPHVNLGIGKKAIGNDGNIITSIEAGGSFRYRIVVFNNGDVDAEDVTVTDDLDDALTIDSTFFDVDTAVPGGSGSCDVGAGNVVTCDLGTVAAKDGTSDSAFVRINVTVPADMCGDLHNQATVHASNEPAEKESDNTSELVTVSVPCATPTPTPTPEQSVSGGTPTPTPTPEESVQGGTGTPAPSQPDTAIPSGGRPSSLPVILFALVLLGSSATLAVANVKRLQSRS